MRMPLPVSGSEGKSHDNHIHGDGDGRKTRMMADMCGIQTFMVLETVERTNLEAQ